MASTYVPRFADAVVERLFASLPALTVVGPRATGKTTTARRYARSAVRLDRPAEAAAFIADPDAALRAQVEPVLLDEWQVVPGVLGAVKRAVDDDARPGRFLLTGSVRADLDAQTWPGTGRVVRIPMTGLTMREVGGELGGPGFVELLATGEVDAISATGTPPDLAAYVEIALTGGFPDVVVGSAAKERDPWLTSYLDQLLTRDAAGISGRDPARLRRYFEVLAINSAGLPEHKTLYDAAGLDRKTADAYDQLLVNLMVLDLVPAWTTNRLSRLIKAPKRYLIDSSLVGVALRADVAAVLRDGDLLGRLLDTFVVAQLRPELALSDARPVLYHLRDKNGRHEIDLLVDLGARGLVGLEVKATAAPTARDAAHLAWLRDELGDRFLAGVVLHTGPATFALGDRIHALPIAAIWGPRRSPIQQRPVGTGSELRASASSRRTRAL